MEKKILMIILGLIICSSVLSQPSAPFRSIQKYLDDAVKKNLSGVAVYIKCPKKGTWTGSAGYSDRSKVALLRPEHVMSLASVGKVYNAVAVFKLVEMDLLSIEDRIAGYLPDSIIENLPNGRVITIRQLLNHTSGLVNYEYDSTLNHLYLTDQLSLDTLSHYEALERYVFGKPSFNEPGEEHYYSSTGYMLLAMIMDRLLPQGHTEFVRSMIAELGMDNTYYREIPTSVRVRYYGDLDQDDVQEDISGKTYETTNWFMGDDGIYSNAEEAGLFMEKLITGQILEDEALSQMMTWDNEKNPNYGQGLFPDKGFPYKFAVGHGGRGIGSTADVYYFPKQKITITILSNTGLRGASPEFRKTYLKMRKRIVRKIFLF